MSIRMVAERAGVSTATVSNVLTGKPHVSQTYADRVRAAAAALGYVPDRHASRLRSGRHSLAGVVVPDLSNPFFGLFVSTLERLARAEGYDLLVMSSDNDAAQEAERLQAIRSWRLSGLIVIPNDGALAERVPPGAGAPIVVADRSPAGDEFDLVGVDNAGAAGAMAAHLAAQGHRSCLVVGSTLAISNVQERWEGVVAAAGGMAVTMLEAGLDPAGIVARLRERLSSGQRPDAVFALDHQTTLAAYQVLRGLHIALGDDLAFASFDETEWMRLVSPPITAVRQPVEAIADAAWTRLMRRIAGDDSPPEQTRLACAIEIRGSSLRPTGAASAAA